MKVEQFLNLYRIAICYSLGDFPMLLQIYFPVVSRGEISQLYEEKV